MSFTEGTPITLQDMLAAREARVARRQRALARFNWPSVTLSLVTPGAIKLSPASMDVAQAAEAALQARFTELGWACETTFSEPLLTGPEAIIAVNTDAHALKTETVALEETHRLGRLWDLDVHAADGTDLSRRDVGLQKRRCLLCDQPAHACTRAQAHSLEELLTAMQARLDQWHAAAPLAPRDERGKP